jgi:hypothetical protein
LNDTAVESSPREPEEAPTNPEPGHSWKLDSPTIPPALVAFRNQYRSNIIGRYYNGYAHLAIVVLGASVVIVGALCLARPPILWHEWMCLPNTLIVANFVEYLGHRGPMHRRFKRMGLIFHRHTNEHHRFFTDECMTCRSQRDYKIVLFPPIMLLFYLGIVAFPIGLLLYTFLTWNTACFYVAAAVFYFLEYEILHFCYHLDDDSWIAQLPIIRALRVHHRIHHHRSLMHKYNFNITWPIADFLFGTIYWDRRKRDDQTP